MTIYGCVSVFSPPNGDVIEDKDRFFWAGTASVVYQQQPSIFFVWRQTGIKRQSKIFAGSGLVQQSCPSLTVSKKIQTQINEPWFYNHPFLIKTQQVMKFDDSSLRFSTLDVLVACLFCLMALKWGSITRKPIIPSASSNDDNFCITLQRPYSLLYPGLNVVNHSS